MTHNFIIPGDRFVQPQTSTAPKADTNASFHAALMEPLEYPPINRSVFAGDSVSFVFTAGLNPIANSIGPLLNVLPGLISDVEVNIVSLQSNGSSDQQLAEFSNQFAESGLTLNFEIHDPANSKSSAQIAINQQGKPLYINRVIFDSDVVIPVIHSSLADSSSASLFPAFGSGQCSARFHSDDLNDAQKRGECRLVEESIGINFVIHVSTSPGGQITAVTAGEKQALADFARNADDTSWKIEQQNEAKVVIATIESETQTWEQCFQAIINASRSSLNSERLVICTNLDELPGPAEAALLQLQFESDQDLISNIYRNLPESHRQIPGILEEKSVYLFSKLEGSDVEELGLGHIDDIQQVQRIIDGADTGVYLRDAHLCEIVEAEKIK